MDSLQILRIWAAAAWADGQLHESEGAALRRLIEASDELTAAERQEAFRLLDGPPAVELAEVRRLAPAAREGAYRAALRIIRLDGRVTDTERDFVARLRATLDLDEATLQRIELEDRARR